VGDLLVLIDIILGLNESLDESVEQFGSNRTFNISEGVSVFVSKRSEILFDFLDFFLILLLFLSFFLVEGNLLVLDISLASVQLLDVAANSEIFFDFISIYLKIKVPGSE
jgi:hypothetical protein